MSNGVQHRDLSLFDCPRIRKSEFWQFIKLVAPHGSPPDGRTHWLSQDATDAYCLKCSKMFRFTKGSSNSVRRHMERFHRKELLKRQADNKKGASSGVSRKPSGTTGAVGGSLQLMARKAKRAMNDVDVLAEDSSTQSQTAPNAPKRTRVDGHSLRDARAGAEALVRWLVLAKRPFTVAEDPGFEDFVTAISGDQPFVAPSREELIHRLELMSENARFETKQIVKKDVPHFTLSAEIWRVLLSSSPSMNSDTQVAIRCSYLGEDFAMQSCVVGAVPFQDLNSDWIIRLLLESGLSKPSLSIFLVSSIDIPNKSYGDAGIRIFPDVVANFNALVHNMLVGSQNIGSDIAETTEPSCSRPAHIIRGAIMEVHALLEWVRSDQNAWAELEKISPTTAGEVLRFPTFDLSQWTLATAHEVISRLIAMRNSIDGLLGRFESCTNCRVKITPQSWLVLEGLIVLWRPLHEVVQVTVNEKVCSLPFALPILGMAMQLYSRANLFDDVKQRFATTIRDMDSSFLLVLDTLRCWVGEFLKNRYEGICSSLAWVSSLDPRYARLRHFSDQEREVCREKLLENAIEVYLRQLPPIQQATETLNTLAPPDFDNDVMYNDHRNPTQHIPGLMHRLLYDDDEDVPVVSDGTLSREADIAQARLYAANEISVYLNEHQMRKTRISCPLQWWCEHRERFPFLAPLARIWLSTRTSTSLMDRSLPVELCESLGSPELRPKLIADLVVLREHLHSSSSGVSL